MVQKVYLEKSPEETTKERNDPENTEIKSENEIKIDKRQKLVEKCQKLDLRHQALMMAYQVIALKIFVGEVLTSKLGEAKYSSEIQWKKCDLIYGKLFSLIFKIDHIGADQSGDDYLNLQELLLDKRLQEKYNVIKEIWVSEELKGEDILRKDWSSILDAIQKDISQLFNNPKFKELIAKIDSTYEGQEDKSQVNIDQLYYVDQYKGNSVPWMKIATNVRTDIENSDKLKDKIEILSEKNTQ